LGWAARVGNSVPVYLLDFFEERGLIFVFYSPMFGASFRGIPVPFGVGFGFCAGLRAVWND
jgi:hypothetical protein